MPDLRPAWRARALSVSACIALAIIAVIAWWPTQVPHAGAPVAGGDNSQAMATTTPHIIEQRLDIQPPPYTALPARSGTALDAKAPAASRLRWSLRFSPQPNAAALEFHDGARLPLRREGGQWIAARRFGQPALYRIVLPTPLPAAQSVLHRIDIVADAPPQLRALQPDRNLTLRAEGQRGWTLVFEADDDYGLATNAQLHITQTAGSGENITATQKTLAMTGSGDRRHKRYARTLDLAALGIAAGDDLIVQLEVADNRAPQAQRTRSPSFILRWPPEDATQSTGMEGLVKKTLPAYFRSQRQIIIDAEALQKDKRRIDAPRFLKRADGIGVDQHLLRLRYGQFLGEESEGAPKLPTNDADDATSASPATQAGALAAARDEHEAQPQAQAFGEEGDTLAEYGHVHDQPEAATLLDPDTKKLLRAALDKMWQSEVNLRQGHPDLALPYAYKALGFIKQVQQATRVYLARTGSETPPIDESRRLHGDRTGLADRGDVLSPATPGDPVPTAAWRALQDAPSADRTPPDFDAIERWARAHGDANGDPLALFAAIDAARRDPDCNACREHLRRALWPMLSRPPAAVASRTRVDKAGQAYLDALERGAAR